MKPLVKVLKERGWTKDEICIETGEVCLNGALIAALDMDPEEYDTDEWEEAIQEGDSNDPNLVIAREYLAEMWKVIQKQDGYIPTPYPDYLENTITLVNKIARFNDDVTITLKDVLKVAELTDTVMANKEKEDLPDELER